MQRLTPSSSILHKWTYVTPAKAHARIAAMHRVCHEGPYLECVLAYAEASDIASRFSAQYGTPSDPAALSTYFEEMHLVPAKDAADPPGE